MKLDHCHRAGCVQIIEQLRTRIAEIEKENVRLKAAVEYAETIRVENIAYFEKQLATSQLRETQLREALENTVRHFGMKRLGQSRLADSEIRCKAHETLSLPTDTSALDAYVSEKVKEIIESHAPEGRNVTNAQHVEMRHKFVEQIATLTRQRDLAVEALEKTRNWFESERKSISKGNGSQWSMRQCEENIAEISEALSTIKESEAMAQGENP